MLGWGGRVGRARINLSIHHAITITECGSKLSVPLQNKLIWQT